MKITLSNTTCALAHAKRGYRILENRRRLWSGTLNMNVGEAMRTSEVLPETQRSMLDYLDGRHGYINRPERQISAFQRVRLRWPFSLISDCSKGSFNCNSFPHLMDPIAPSQGGSLAIFALFGLGSSELAHYCARSLTSKLAKSLYFNSSGPRTIRSQASATSNQSAVHTHLLIELHDRKSKATSLAHAKRQPAHRRRCQPFVTKDDNETDEGLLSGRKIISSNSIRNGDLLT